MCFGVTAPGSGCRTPLHPSSPGARAGPPAAQHRTESRSPAGAAPPSLPCWPVGEGFKGTGAAPGGRRAAGLADSVGFHTLTEPRGSWASGGLPGLAFPAEADQTQGPLKGGSPLAVPAQHSLSRPPRYQIPGMAVAELQDVPGEPRAPGGPQLVEP
ncbi:PREDICTED: collagen alpha-1(III) chain-like [Myotis brandtii]|uniref:collagen alpha-1(III) chain-like n=1 Tax=Myotis brandtii TaxID=109478 RepID=UPI000703F8F3|nr:PREDICTED: collagen alpha-1(III) chain-like [Myotis brandtii]